MIMGFKLNKKAGRVAVAVVTMMAVAAVSYAAEHGGGHGEQVLFTHEKLMDLLYRVLNFAVLVLLLVKFLKKPVANGLASRRRTIQDEFEDLESRKAEAEAKYKEYEARISRLDEEVEKIIAAAVSQGEAEKAKIIADAERAAEDIKRQAESAVANEIAQVRQRLRAEIAEEVTRAAEKMISDSLTADDQQRLVEDYLAKVGAIQ